MVVVYMESVQGTPQIVLIHSTILAVLVTGKHLTINSVLSIHNMHLFVQAIDLNKILVTLLWKKNLTMVLSMNKNLWPRAPLLKNQKFSFTKKKYSLSQSLSKKLSLNQYLLKVLFVRKKYF